METPKNANLSPERYFKSHRKGSSLHSNEKQIILNVYSQLRKENMLKDDAIERTCQLTGG